MKIEKLFFDANIILDMIDSDRGNVKKARELVYQALIKDISLFTSCDILSNIYYVAQKRLDKTILVEEMLRILEIFEITPIDKSTAKNALLENKKDPSLDFEDLLQSHYATISKCDILVTNDKKFAKGKVKHLSLDEVIEVI